MASLSSIIELKVLRDSIGTLGFGVEGYHRELKVNRDSIGIVIPQKGYKVIYSTTEMGAGRRVWDVGLRVCGV